MSVSKCCRALGTTWKSKSVGGTYIQADTENNSEVDNDGAEVPPIQLYSLHGRASAREHTRHPLHVPETPRTYEHLSTLVVSDVKLPEAE